MSEHQAISLKRLVTIMDWLSSQGPWIGTVTMECSRRATMKAVTGPSRRASRWVKYALQTSLAQSKRAKECVEKVPLASTARRTYWEMAKNLGVKLSWLNSQLVSGFNDTKQVCQSLIWIQKKATRTRTRSQELQSSGARRKAVALVEQVFAMSEPHPSEDTKRNVCLFIRTTPGKKNRACSMTRTVAVADTPASSRTTNHSSRHSSLTCTPEVNLRGKMFSKVSTRRHLTHPPTPSRFTRQAKRNKADSKSKRMLASTRWSTCRHGKDPSPTITMC